MLEFNLSNKIEEDFKFEKGNLSVEDVKEFIKVIKEKIETITQVPIEDNRFCKIIDKYSGEKLK